jgi:O-antigen/teichoic acid export membrane protein
VDRIAIAAFLSLTEVGLFGIAHRAALLTQVLLMGLQTAVTPLIYASHQESRTPADLAKIFRFFTMVVLIMWLGLGLFATELLELATTQAYVAAAPAVPLLVPAVVLSGAYVFMPGAAIARRTGVIAAINISHGFLNLLLNLVLVPFLGIVGAAGATLLTSVSAFVTNAIVSQRTYPVPHNWRVLALASVMTASIVAAGWFMGHPSATGQFRIALLLVGVAGTIALLRRPAALGDLAPGGTQA